MAKFDENKVINVLHPEKAKVGKRYWYADELMTLKMDVESDTSDTLILKRIDNENDYYPFLGTGCYSVCNTDRYSFLYPYEEPPKQRMTNIQLMEWLSKGKGLILIQDKMGISSSLLCYKDELNNEVAENILIRPWDSDEWIEPTVDIYERDCKGKENV